ncbi:MAG: Rap1a/Tai family immunity protein [Desulfobacterales bacterium]
MKRMVWMVFLLAVVMVQPVLAQDLNAEAFEVKTTKDLIALCDTAPDEPLFAAAIHFCHGYLVGAFHYHEASIGGPNAERIVCLPEVRPSRNETVGKFVQWVKAHPEYWDELPVETEFRFLTETFPCSE